MHLVHTSHYTPVAISSEQHFVILLFGRRQVEFLVRLLPRDARRTLALPGVHAAEQRRRAVVAQPSASSLPPCMAAAAAAADPAAHEAKVAKALKAMTGFANSYVKNTKTKYCAELSIPSVVIKGLAEHKVALGAPLCPCRHYEDKQAEAKDGYWNCPCVPMRERHGCHCMLFLTADNEFVGEEDTLTVEEVRPAPPPPCWRRRRRRCAPPPCRCHRSASPRARVRRAPPPRRPQVRSHTDGMSIL